MNTRTIIAAVIVVLIAAISYVNSTGEVDMAIPSSNFINSDEIPDRLYTKPDLPDPIWFTVLYTARDNVLKNMLTISEGSLLIGSDGDVTWQARRVPGRDWAKLEVRWKGEIVHQSSCYFGG